MTHLHTREILTIDSVINRPNFLINKTLREDPISTLLAPYMELVLPLSDSKSKYEKNYIQKENKIVNITNLRGGDSNFLLVDKPPSRVYTLVKLTNRMDEGGKHLCEAAKNGDAEKLKSLIDSGGDVSYFDAEGLNPLMHAAQLGHAAAVKTLLEAGAPWNALSPSNLSAGDLAMNAGHEEAYELVLDAGIQAELVLGTIARRENNDGVCNDEYLEDRVSFSEDKLMDAENKAVMMAWENPLMEAHAKAVCSNGGNILNVGFGMGMVDTAIQKYSPASHTIVEAHPDVFQRMVDDGWDKKPNVTIICGRWQDVVDELPKFDGIFFDTYGEYYDDLREFHQQLPALLKQGGIYSFFNGLCGGNAFFHVVYCHIVQLELQRLGYSTQFIPLPVKDCLGEKVWEGVKQKYWQLDTYYLPVCQVLEDSE